MMWQSSIIPFIYMRDHGIPQKLNSDDAGHVVTDQYPEVIAKILSTFLSTTNPNN